MRHIVSFRGFGTNYIMTPPSPGVSTVFVYTIFNTEMFVNRYDSTAATSTARGWFLT